MLLERRPGGEIEVYLAVRRGGRQERKKLGQFGKLSADGQIQRLAYWRQEAERVAAAARDFPTLDAYENHVQRLKAEQERIESQAARQGSFEQFFAGLRSGYGATWEDKRPRSNGCPRA